MHIFQKFEPKTWAPCMWLQSCGFGKLQSTGAALLGSSATTQLLLSLRSCSPLCPDTAGLWGRTSLLCMAALCVGHFARLVSLWKGLRGRKEVFLPSLVMLTHWKNSLKKISVCFDNWAPARMPIWELSVGLRQPSVPHSLLSLPRIPRRVYERFWHPPLKEELPRLTLPRPNCRVAEDYLLRLFCLFQAHIRFYEL